MLVDMFKVLLKGNIYWGPCDYQEEAITTRGLGHLLGGFAHFYLLGSSPSVDAEALITESSIVHCNFWVFFIDTAGVDGLDLDHKVQLLYAGSRRRLEDDLTVVKIWSLQCPHCVTPQRAVISRAAVTIYLIFVRNRKSPWALLALAQN